MAVSGALVVASVGVVACGDSTSSSSSPSSSSGSTSTGSTSTSTGGACTKAVPTGGKLTIYSSLPLTGSSRNQSLDVIDGIKLAISEHGGKAGGFPINYQSLDDATAAEGKWDAGQTKTNARKASLDKSTIAYIGEFNSGASANSIPTTNQACILQVSPSNTALGLTKGGAGAEAGEPQKYYPTGQRNYGRVVPIDTIQGAAQANYMKDEGVKSVYILDDQEVYGKGVAANTSSAAEKLGIKIAGSDSWDGKASNYRALAAKVKASGADAVFTGGIIDNNAPQLYKDLHAAMPTAKLFGPDGVATVDFTKEIPADVQAVTFLTAPTVSPNELPPAGQKFYKDFESTYNQPEDEVDPYAVYGYEAADDVLNSIDQGKDDRAAVIKAFFSIKDKDSVLGTYSIDPDGDTTLTTYGAYIAKGGKLVFSKAIKASS